MIKLRPHSLVAWQRADDLFIRLHQLTAKEFPAFERFVLGGQLRRAAYSVPANIVEGFARRHRRARLHFLNIAEASLAELTYCLHVAERLGGNYLTVWKQQADGTWKAVFGHRLSRAGQIGRNAIFTSRGLFSRIVAEHQVCFSVCFGSIINANLTRKGLNC